MLVVLQNASLAALVCCCLFSTTLLWVTVHVYFVTLLFRFFSLDIIWYIYCGKQSVRIVNHLIVATIEVIQ